MEKISATIIAFNEEKRIAACLESLHGIADEIIVVDSMSTDRTVEIAREHGAKVTHRRFDGFGAQRQYATSLTTHRYVLSIDADEVLSPALRQALLRLKEEGFAHRVYSLSRLNFYCGYPVRHCGWYPDPHIRLFDKRYANWNLRDVGEKVVFRDNVTPSAVDGDILHYRCDTPEQFEAVVRRHAAIKGALIASRGEESVSPLTPLAKALGAFCRSYLMQGGILEGQAGRDISAQAFRSEFLAYSEARRRLRLEKTNNS
ncbi:MAG: glycosyltransferase family 2 protein [Duncaniella sp.]|nr:glycosyltransferase family 2 protein [Duncaniella sp.]